MKACPSCGVDSGKQRVGTLGELLDEVWCTNCGYKARTDVWENACRAGEKYTWTGSAEPTISFPASSARKMFNSRKHGPLYQACPGVDVLPLIDVDAIPAENLSMVLDYFFGESWSEHADPRYKRDRIRELVT